jgi:hypothetical protein
MAPTPHNLHVQLPHERGVVVVFVVDGQDVPCELFDV